MADFSRIGRNNKNRGRAFERQVAEKLGWSRVPYSGAIKEWGGADVVDGFYTRNGLWAAECKTQQPGVDGSISIKHKWVMQMYGGESNGRHGVIITKTHRSRDAYVFMLEDTFLWFYERSDDSVPGNIDDIFVESKSSETYTRGKGHNFVLKSEEFPVDGYTRLDVGGTKWYVFHLNDFVNILETTGLFVPIQLPEDTDG